MSRTTATHMVMLAINYASPEAVAVAIAVKAFAEAEAEAVKAKGTKAEASAEKARQEIAAELARRQAATKKAAAELAEAVGEFAEVAWLPIAFVLGKGGGLKYIEQSGIEGRSYRVASFSTEKAFSVGKVEKVVVKRSLIAQ